MAERQLHTERAEQPGGEPVALVLGRGQLVAVVPALGKGVLRALEPWRAPGCVVNFLGEVNGPAEVAAAYPPGVAERLLAVKQAVDPDRVFSFGHALWGAVVRRRPLPRAG